LGCGTPRSTNALRAKICEAYLNEVKDHGTFYFVPLWFTAFHSRAFERQMKIMQECLSHFVLSCHILIFLVFTPLKVFILVFSRTEFFEQILVSVLKILFVLGILFVERSN